MTGITYIGDTETDTEERFKTLEVVFMFRYGVDIKGCSYTKTGGVSINPASPISKDNARTLLTKGYSVAVLNGHIKTITVTDSYKATSIVVGDYGQYIDDLAISMDLARAGVTMVFDDRVKSVGIRWLDNDMWGNVGLDLSRVTDSFLRTSIYKSIGGKVPSNFVDTAEDKDSYIHEALVNHSSDIKIRFTAESHAFYIKRNKKKLLVAINSITRDKVKSNTAHRTANFPQLRVKNALDTLRKGYPPSVRVLTELIRMDNFVHIQDRVVRNYLVAGGQDKDIYEAYCKVLDWILEDYNKAYILDKLGLSAEKRMPYLQYLELIDEVTELHRSGMSPYAIIEIRSLREKGLRMTSK